MNAYEQTKKEIKEELDRELIDKYKLQLKSKKLWFPWRIQIINLNKEK